MTGTMKWGMVVDLSKCVRCYGCVVACRAEHFLPIGIDRPRLVAFEPEKNETPAVVTTFPVRCNQCEEAPCVKVCPTGATFKREDGIVAVDQDKCVGCRYCVVVCPYQNRAFLAKSKDKGFFPGKGLTDFEKAGKRLYPHQHGTTEKCDFCMERIDAGIAAGLRPGVDRGATPACVNTCQARALTFGDLDDFDSAVSRTIRERKGVPLCSEFGTRPSIYYVDKRKIGMEGERVEMKVAAEEISSERA
jgi:phenylacetyl-CoA:acceptor oxidoreductase 27-kDa subunit